MSNYLFWGDPSQESKRSAQKGTALGEEGFSGLRRRLCFIVGLTVDTGKNALGQEPFSKHRKTLRKTQFL